MEQQQNTVWTTGYLPNGMKASFTFVITDPMNAFAEAMSYLGKLQADGLLMNEVGLGEGEQAETVGYIVRMKKKSKSGVDVPMLDLYFDNEVVKFKFLTVYLNTAEEVSAFEQASGVKLDSMKLWVGGHIERGANDDTDAYITRMPRPFKVVHKPNPRYDANETDQTKKKPKRLFVRWEGVQNAPQSNEKPVSSDFEPVLITLTVADIDAIKKAHSDLSGDQLKAALNIKEKWSEWTTGKDAALKAIADYKLALPAEAVPF